MAVYGKDFYKDMPVISVNKYGDGKAYYIGTEPEADCIESFFMELFDELDIKAHYETSKNVELTRRVNEENDLLFVLNWNKEEAFIDLREDSFKNMINDEEFTGKVVLNPYDAVVLKKLN